MAAATGPIGKRAKPRPRWRPDFAVRSADTLPDSPLEIAVSADGSRVAIALGTSGIALFAPGSDAAPRILPLPPAYGRKIIASVAFLGNSRIVFGALGIDAVSILTIDGGIDRITLRTFTSPLVRTDRAGSTVYVGDRDGIDSFTVTKVAVTNGSFSARGSTQRLYTWYEAPDFSISGDGSQLFIAADPLGALHTVDTVSMKVVSSRTIPSLPDALAVDPHGRRLALASLFDAISLLLTPGAGMTRIPQPAIPSRNHSSVLTNGLAFNDTGATLFAAVEAFGPGSQHEQRIAAIHLGREDPLCKAANPCWTALANIRQSDPDSVRFWSTLVANPANAKGESLAMAGIMGSDEYQAANPDLIGSLYLHALNRAPSAAERAAVVHQLRSVPLSRYAENLLAAPEAYQTLIARMYKSYLDRPASVDSLKANDAGVAFWAAVAAKPETSLRDVRSALLASDEFYGKSGATPAGFIAALYQRVLDRCVSDGELDQWLGNGSTDFNSPAIRQQIARTFLLSDEGSGAQVAQYYNVLLKRGSRSACSL